MAAGGSRQGKQSKTARTSHSLAGIRSPPCVLPQSSTNQNASSETYNASNSGSSTVSIAASTSAARSNTPSHVSSSRNQSVRTSPRPVVTPQQSNIAKRDGKVKVSSGKYQGKQGKLGTNSQIIPPLGFGGPKITPELYSKQFPYALPLESEVYCWYTARECWFSATIIHARPTALHSISSTASSSKPNSSKSSTISGGYVSAISGGKYIQISGSRQLNYLTPGALSDELNMNSFEWDGREAEYDYYVHFHGEDRRQDMWVVASLLRPKDFEFHPKEPCIYAPPGPDEIHKHMDADYLREHEENTKLKTIGKIRVGEYLVDTWYFSPYPKEFQNLDILYICEYCLNYFKYECELISHSVLCSLRTPPGDEIYRDYQKDISVFEIDGSLSRQYAENLCFLSKLFLDHKTLRHPVYLFLFYVVAERRKEGHRVVGYFSKEKYSKNNLSCIMCLPQHQRKGYGQFLINLSYALSRREGKRGTPERPLSDLGKATYIKYWSQTVVAALLSPPLAGAETVTLEQIAQETSIEIGDIAMALDAVGILSTSLSYLNVPGVNIFAQSTPYIFIPDEYLAAASKWCRIAFVNNIIPKSNHRSLFQIGLEESKLPNCDPSVVIKTEELCSTAVSKVTERRSKRRRSSIFDEETENREWDFGKRVKIYTSIGSTNCRQDESTEVNPKTPVQLLPIAPINLADLRWESYDLHLGPYEYTPVIS